MKQVLLTCIGLACIASASAQEDWTPYRISRYSFIFDIPPGFKLFKGHEEENVEGGLFKNPEGDILSVWGMSLKQGDFALAVEDQKQKDEADGWEITYQHITPKWAAYSGIRDGVIRYMKAIPVCDDRAAFFYMDYDRNMKNEYDPVINQMEKSMKREGC